MYSMVLTWKVTKKNLIYGIHKITKNLDWLINFAAGVQVAFPDQVVMYVVA